MEYNMSQILRLAQSPAGKQFIEYLQKNGGDELQTAVFRASSGDFASAKEALSNVLASPKAQELLKQLEESK